MPRDYKYRAASKKKQKQTPAWLWLLVGLLVGAFVVGLAWLKLDDGTPEPKWVGAQPDRPPQQAESQPPVVELPPRKPRFEFFDKLPHQEVVVPSEQLDLRASRAAPDPTASYVIQIASFAKSQEAEKARAEVALLGVETRVERAHLQDGSTRYRVLAGPYLGRTGLDKVRNRLKQNGYRQMLVRVLR
jgi:cell division protein FtsN